MHPRIGCVCPQLASRAAPSRTPTADSSTPLLDSQASGAGGRVRGGPASIPTSKRVHSKDRSDKRQPEELAVAVVIFCIHLLLSVCTSDIHASRCNAQRLSTSLTIEQRTAFQHLDGFLKEHLARMAVETRSTVHRSTRPQILLFLAVREHARTPAISGHFPSTSHSLIS